MELGNVRKCNLGGLSIPSHLVTQAVGATRDIYRWCGDKASLERVVPCSGCILSSYRAGFHFSEHSANALVAFDRLSDVNDSLA